MEDKNNFESKNRSSYESDYIRDKEDLSVLFPLVIALGITGLTGYKIHKISLIRGWLRGTITKAEIIL